MTNVEDLDIQHLPIIAYIHKFGDLNIGSIAARRDKKEPDLLTFLYWFTPAIIGAKKWKMKCRTENYTDLMTVSDEAYLCLMVEGNYNKWLYMKNRSVCAQKELLS